MLYAATPVTALPCGCPSWKAEVHDAIGRKLDGVLRVDPVEGWAEFHRAHESGRPLYFVDDTPVVDRIEGFFIVRCAEHPGQLLT